MLEKRKGEKMLGKKTKEKKEYRTSSLRAGHGALSSLPCCDIGMLMDVHVIKLAGCRSPGDERSL
jgi:hypothetical protein